MKKILFVLFVLAFSASLCFAQNSEEPSGDAAQSVPSTPQAETKSLTGKVSSVSVGNVNEGIKPQVIVTDNNGQALTLTIEPDSIIADKDANVLTVIDIKNDSDITVTYVTDTDGTNKVQSLEVTQQEMGDNQ